MAKLRGGVLLVGAGVLLALPPSSPIQWENFGGPGGCVITALAASGGRLFAGTDFGVFISADGGRSWTRAGELGPPLMGGSEIRSILASGNDLFAVAGRELFRSTDGGAVWTVIHAGLPEWSQITCLLDVGSALYCGLLDDGLFVSSDRGGTWLEIGTSLPANVRIEELAALGPTLFALDYFHYGFYQSADNGATWTHVNPGLPAGVYAIDLAVCGRKLFAYTTQGIFALGEGDPAWRKVMDGGMSADLGYFAASGQILLVQADKSCFLSSDSGATWKTVAGLPVSDSQEISGFVADGSCLFAAVEGSGLFRSGDLGVSWISVETGFPRQASISCLARSGTDLFAAVREWDQSDRLFRRSEGNSGWEPTGTPFQEQTWIKCLTAAGGNLIAGTDAGLFLSDDRGGSWAAVGPAAPVSVNCFEIDGSRVVAGTDQGIFLTDDRGRTWTKVLGDSFSRGSIAGFARIGDALFAGRLNDLFVTKDHGKTWSPVVTGLHQGTHIDALATDGKVLMAAVYPWPEEKIQAAQISDETSEYPDIGPLYLYPEFGLLVSEDGGRRWKPAARGLPDKFRVGLLAAGPFGFIASLENTYTKAGRWSLGLYLSKDGGLTWTENWPGRWSAKPFNGFLFGKDGILAATEDAGIWRLPPEALKMP